MKTQTTSKKNTAKLTAALFALILLFPCCMDSGSGESSSDSSDTIVAPAEPSPDNSGNDDSTDNNGDDSGKTEPAEPKPDTPDDSETTTEIDSNTDMSKLNPTKTYIFKATDGTVDAEKLVLAKKILGENLSFTETNVNYILDFSNKSFANTTDEIESRSEYASKKGLTSSTSIITDENLTETIKIGDVEFITKPIYYNGDDDKVIQQAFKFGKKVDNVKVTFGNSHSMTEAYKGGIILENSNAKITSDDVNSTNLTGQMYVATIDTDNSLVSKLSNDSKIYPTLSFNLNFLGNFSERNLYGTGIDKIYKKYNNSGKSDKLLATVSSGKFDAKDYLNGGYMYDKDGIYNNNAYSLDINTALLMCEKLGIDVQNVIITGDMTEETDAVLSGTNTRFSGNVSGLNFTSNNGKGIIDFAGVGPKSEITAVGAKVIVRGLKEGSYEGIYTANTLDFYGVDKTLLENIEVGNATKRVYGASSSNFSLVNNRDTVFKTTSSASTNQAWEKKGRGETVSNSDLISKLDVKAKVDNPLLQKLLDENRPVYG